MLRAILFDLDGTLLPMDQDLFVKSYLKGMAVRMAGFGYAPSTLVDGSWAGTSAMVSNDGMRINEDVFWKTFSSYMGKDARQDEKLFEDFYRNEFQSVRQVCGFAPEAAALISDIKKIGLRVGLATNPLFPAIATHSRIRWAGLVPEDFEIVTTYENSRFCKPNPDYYREILDMMELAPEDCLMVGNDAVEDLAAQVLGIKVFLLTDCLINTKNIDISRCPQGGFEQLRDYIWELLGQ